ncbi:MAG: phospholipid carrier-dependent glycosyltransferase [Anaerolineae bacterium]
MSVTSRQLSDKSPFKALEYKVLGFYLADMLWLVLLIVYAAVGMMLAPFHVDEAMHLYTSRDYATAFINHQPEQLPVNPPYEIDSDSRLRLLNGSVMRYSMGLSWQLAGLTVDDLPPRPGWDWGMFYQQNVETGHRPREALLQAGRTVAVIYLAVSIVALFGIGREFGGRATAYLASLLYTINPIILLNGRRALVESALLAFGLLTIWVALQIVKRQKPHALALSPHAEMGNSNVWLWWLALAVCGALTLASKYSGTIFVAGAFGGIFVTALLKAVSRRMFRPMLSVTGKLIISGVFALALLVVLSPALWSDPISRARDLAAMLQEQVDIVVSILPDAPTTMQQRIEGIVTQSFIAPVAYFEQASWAEAAPITQEIAHYEASPLSGLRPNLAIGGVLTLLAGWGLVALFWRQRNSTSAVSVVVLIWLLVTVLNLLINPLPWQRYYLVLIPIMTLLAAVGTSTLYRIFRPQSP